MIWDMVEIAACVVETVLIVDFLGRFSREVSWI